MENRVKPSFAVSKAVANPDLQIRGVGGEGGAVSKKKFFPALRASEKIRGEDPSLGSTTEKCPNSCRRGLAC